MSVKNTMHFQQRRVRRLLIVTFGRLGLWRFCLAILDFISRKDKY